MNWLSFRILSPGFSRIYYRHPPRSSRNDARETRGRHPSEPSGTARLPGRDELGIENPWPPLAFLSNQRSHGPGGATAAISAEV